MDEGLFLFMLLSGFVFFCAIIYCFLSTCLGVQLRRSDIWEALALPTPATIRERDRLRQLRSEREQFEMDDMDRLGGTPIGGGMGWDDRFGAGPEGVEAMRRSGIGRGFF